LREPVLALLRPRDRMAESARLALAHGFAPLVAPLLERAPVDGEALEPLFRALDQRRIAWVTFSSEHAVREAWARAAERGLDLAALLRGARIAAIGRATRQALRERGVDAEVPPEQSSAGLVALLRERGVRGQRVALVRSDRGSQELPRGLAALGAEVEDAAVYALRLPQDLEDARALLQRAAEGRVDAWAFTSSLTVEHLLAVARGADAEQSLRAALARSAVGAVGKPTAAALERNAIRCDVVSPEASFEELLRGLKKHLEGR
jgi:uroporphyrinogen-III synthase